MGVLSEVSQHEPIQFRDVLHITGYLSSAQGTLAANEVFITKIVDQDFKTFAEDILQKGLMAEIQILQSLLQTNGLVLPPAPPSVSVNNLPPNLTMNDAQIAADFSKKISSSLLVCSQIVGESCHEDIGAIFERFHMSKAQVGARLVQLMKQKGWLVRPTLYL